MDETLPPPLPKADSAEPEAARAAEIFRDDSNLATPPEPPTPEMETLIQERAALKAARDQALSATSDTVFAPGPGVPPAATIPAAAATQVLPTVASAPAPTPALDLPDPSDKSLGRKPNDGFWSSLGLLLARLATAFIFGVHGLNTVTHVDQTQEFLGRTILPNPEILVWVLGVSELAIAVALVFGLLTRFAGLGVALIAGGALAFYYWGPWSIFVEGQAGFLGELEVALASLGCLFLFVGGGGWSLDRSFRVGRARDKAEQALVRAGN